MLSNPNRQAVQRIEPKADLADALINKGSLTAADSLRLHWPEYLMEGGEAAIYLFSACAVATFLWHPGSPVQRYLPSDGVRRMLMGWRWARRLWRSSFRLGANSPERTSIPRSHSLFID